MSALDQAFVKAYQRLDGAHSPAILRPVQPVAKAEVRPATAARKPSPRVERSNAAVCEALAKVFQQEPTRRPKAAPKEPADWIGTLLDSPRAKVARHGVEAAPKAEAAVRSEPASAPNSAAPAATPPSPATVADAAPTTCPAEPMDQQSVEPPVEAAVAAAAEPVALAATHPPAPVSKAEETTAERAVALAAPALAAPLPAAPAPATRSTSEASGPLLRVDGLLWPDNVLGLLAKGLEALDSVVEHVMADSRAGRKVVALTACRRGEGCTSLTLAVARRLADRHVHAALVDADLDRPRLARRLGLAPQIGYSDVLLGRASLAESLIHSAKDGLDVLPGVASSAPVVDADPGDVLGQLRAHYDVVLVDLGVGRAAAAPSAMGGDRLSHWADSALLIHNVRQTPAEEAAARWGQLRGAGVAQVAIVENCVC